MVEKFVIVPVLNSNNTMILELSWGGGGRVGGEQPGGNVICWGGGANLCEWVGSWRSCEIIHPFIFLYPSFSLSAI